MELSAKTGGIASVVLLLSGFLGGFVPQFQRANTQEAEVQRLTTEAGQLRSQERLSRLRDMVSIVYFQASRKNYGLASEQAAALFKLAEELSNGAEEGPKPLARRILQDRDALVGGLAKGDDGVMGLLAPLVEAAHGIKK
jgi:hypothetical protein